MWISQDWPEQSDAYMDGLITVFCLLLHISNSSLKKKNGGVGDEG